MDTHDHLVSARLHGNCYQCNALLTMKSRINRIEKGHCVIGVERQFLIVPVAFDVGISV